MQLRSSAFSPGQVIPTRYTGEGADMSPPMNWSNLPAGTKELALIVDDPDAPREEPWVHWLIYNLSPEVAGLPEAVPQKLSLEKIPGARQGRNSFETLDIGYRGPMPPKGHGVHHYRFRLYALDAALDLEPGLEKRQLLEVIEGHVLETAELVGTYQR